MKTITKNILAASTILILSSVVFTPVSAMNGSGNGGGNSQGQGMQQGNGNGQGQGKGQGQGQGQKGAGMDSHNPADGIADIPASDLSDIEIDLLLKQYEEEMMANELYSSFYEMYGTEVFKNIADSEAKHMTAVQALLDRYNIETPTDYDHIKDLYEELKAAGAISEKDALEVGVKIEFVDIDDIVTAIKATDNDDIKVIFTNIGGGSYNHLRGFVKALDNGGYETDLDYNQYLSDEELAIKGPLKYKLAEVLEQDGVELPEQVSSESMKAKKDEGSHSVSSNTQEGEKENSSKYSAYKKTISTEYGERIEGLSNDKLELLITKIDTLSESVQSSSEYSQDTKMKYKMILGALREIVLETLEGELDLDGLFE